MAKTDKNKTKRKSYNLTDSIDDKQVLHILNEEVVYYLSQNKERNAEADGLTDGEIKEIQAGLDEIEREDTIPWLKLKKEWLNGVRNNHK